MTKHLSANLLTSLTRCLAPDRQGYVLSLPDERANPSHSCFQEEGAVEPTLRGQPRADRENYVEVGIPALQGQASEPGSPLLLSSLDGPEEWRVAMGCCHLFLIRRARQAQALLTRSTFTTALRPATCRCLCSYHLSQKERQWGLS